MKLMEQNARDYQKCYKNAIMLKVEIAMIEKTVEIFFPFLCSIQ